MSSVHILIEQALGYVLLKVSKCKSVDELLLLLQATDFTAVKTKIKLAEFQPFSSVNNASLNCQDIANGTANDDLLGLLRRHLSEGRCTLVVGDRKLLESLKAANINENLDFNGDNAMIIHLRRVRHAIHEFMNDKQEHLLRAHIGLGHSFSRMKIKYNVNRADNMIIQSINLLDQLDKDINNMAMRLREWFGYHYPELVKIVNDNRAYCNVVRIIGSRAGAVDDVLEKLEEAVGDSDKAKQIIITARTSMGYELTEEDLMNIGHVANKTLAMMSQREDTAKYLNSKMALVAPNFSTLVGDIVAARLISHAGSLINLAKFPASTIQILGAEKALFRALKTRTNTPKYGLIFHSSYIGRAAKQDKGRISRFLAAKISLAVRLDCFMEEPMNIFGIHLKKQVEDQLKYLETGQEPRKNYEAMEEAVVDAKRFVAELKISRDMVENDDLKKRKISIKDVVEPKKIKLEVVQNDITESKSSKKKRKSEKKVADISMEEIKPINVEIISNTIDVKVENGSVDITEEGTKKKRKSEKRKVLEEVMVVDVNVESNVVESIVVESIVVESIVAESIVVESIEKESKKKRKSKKILLEDVIEVKSEINVVELNDGVSKKKKSHKKDKSIVNECEYSVKTEEVIKKEEMSIEKKKSKKGKQ